MNAVKALLALQEERCLAYASFLDTFHSIFRVDRANSFLGNTDTGGDFKNEELDVKAAMTEYNELIQEKIKVFNEINIRVRALPLDTLALKDSMEQLMALEKQNLSVQVELQKLRIMVQLQSNAHDEHAHVRGHDHRSPRAKSDLFSEQSKELVAERNEIHASINELLMELRAEYLY